MPIYRTHVCTWYTAVFRVQLRGNAGCIIDYILRLGSLVAVRFWEFLGMWYGLSLPWIGGVSAGVNVETHTSLSDLACGSHAFLNSANTSPLFAERRTLPSQIGGSDTTDVREACRLARPYNYDAINLNCGCPSEKVAGKGAFGAALMRSPSHVRDLCLAMRDGAGEGTPITVKCRIGVDDDDSYEQLAAFVDEVRGAWCVVLGACMSLWQPQEKREVGVSSC